MPHTGVRPLSSLTRKCPASPVVSLSEPSMPSPGQKLARASIPACSFIRVIARTVIRGGPFSGDGAEIMDVSNRSGQTGWQAQLTRADARGMHQIGHNRTDRTDRTGRQAGRQKDGQDKPGRQADRQDRTGRQTAVHTDRQADTTYSCRCQLTYREKKTATPHRQRHFSSTTRSPKGHDQ